MSDCVFLLKGDDTVQVVFECESEKILAIGEKMASINEEAYMNGYNWDAFFNYYLGKYAPDLLEGLDSDPEAGSYAGYYPLTPENEVKAQKFADLIRKLSENEEELYRVVREEGGEIEWD